MAKKGRWTINWAGEVRQVHLGNGSLSQLGKHVTSRFGKKRRVVVLTDTNLESFHAPVAIASLEKAKHTVHQMVLPPGESVKSLNQAEQIYMRLADLQADRETVFVVVGGGVLSDLGGFVASTFCRGIPLAVVPTTLLSQVDAGIGGKVGVNLPSGKNLVGSFYPAQLVIIDPELLRTLPMRERVGGAAEVIKYGIIGGKSILDRVKKDLMSIFQEKDADLIDLVRTCINYKIDVVKQDLTDTKGIRIRLNYGHTFGHAIEAAARYNIHHGEAVAMGMATAARIGHAMKVTPEALMHEQNRLLHKALLPTEVKNIPVETILHHLEMDKKRRGGNLQYLLPRRIGQVTIVDDIPRALMKDALQGTVPTEES
jgi:3-dehydroquinate synthase